MIIDNENRFSDAQAFSASAVSTNVIDLSQARNIQDGEPLGVMLTVNAAADHTIGDETYEYQFLTDDNAAMGSPTIIDDQVILFSRLTLNKKIFLPLPLGANLERYVAVKMVLAGTTPSVTLTADLMPQSFVDKADKQYPSGFSIL